LSSALFGERAANSITLQIGFDGHARDKGKAHLTNNFIPTQPLKFEARKFFRRQILPSTGVPMSHASFYQLRLEQHQYRVKTAPSTQCRYAVVRQILIVLATLKPYV
jgi:hypothetical protein